MEKFPKEHKPLEEIVASRPFRRISDGEIMLFKIVDRSIEFGEEIQSGRYALYYDQPEKDKIPYRRNQDLINLIPLAHSFDSIDEAWKYATTLENFEEVEKK